MPTDRCGVPKVEPAGSARHPHAASNGTVPDDEIAFAPLPQSVLAGVAGVLALAAVDTAMGLEEMRAVVADAGWPPPGQDDRAAAAIVISLATQPRVILQPPALAASSLLRMLVCLGALRWASFWLSGDPNGPVQLAAVGSGTEPNDAAELATRAISEGRSDVPIRSGVVEALPIVRHGAPAGALVVHHEGERNGLDRLIANTAGIAAVIADRALLLDRSTAAEQILADAGERRLRRVGLDLHDGPLQQTAQLARDIKFLRSQIDDFELVATTAFQIKGRLDDLAARLAAADDELRHLASSFESPLALNVPFETALKEEVGAFERRTSIRAHFEMLGSLEGVAPAQRLTLFRMIQEAFANVRQHSSAANVWLRVRTESAGVRVSVVDDGVGFDPMVDLRRAHARRRLGLPGMRERANLVGGALQIESRPGGPTTLSIFLPATRSLPDLVSNLVSALDDQPRDVRRCR